MNQETNTELQEELVRLFELAVKNKLCTTKKEFAALVGASRSAVTAAMNGDMNYLTQNLVNKCARALGEHITITSGNTMTNSDHASGNTQNNYVTKPEDVRAIVDRLVDEMSAQRESYEKIITALIEKVAK